MAQVVSLIQGASRGIGLQFCQTILKRHPNSVVIATCRQPDNSLGLQELKAKNPDRVNLCVLDVNEDTQIENVAKFTKEKYGKLDLLINNAGMLHTSGRGETSLREISRKGLMETFETNTAGPLLMAKHFAPLLKLGSGYFGIKPADSKKQHCSVLVNMSAKVGSITDNHLGGWYSYRMSKAALNMCSKNLSIELGRGSKPVICVSLHPGTVDTDLSRPYHKNVPKLFTTEYSVDCLMDIVESLTISDTGKFLLYDRTVYPF
ncbi:C-signal-like [Ylistrum balloti]|uniref:C-signal-like n=1 Tax=Ylistrum balloti TaxID=509963 RepID=UPI002905C265|nr:C-signal-like [Ylistrum balloti]